MKRAVAIIIASLIVLGLVSCSCGGDNSESGARVESGGEWTDRY